MIRVSLICYLTFGVIILYLFKRKIGMLQKLESFHYIMEIMWFTGYCEMCEFSGGCEKG